MQSFLLCSVLRCYHSFSAEKDACQVIHIQNLSWYFYIFYGIWFFYHVHCSFVGNNMNVFHLCILYSCVFWTIFLHVFMHVNVSGRSVLLFNKLIDWLIDLYLLAYHRSYACSSLWASWSIQPFGHSGKEGLLCPFWGELGPHLTQRPDSSLRYRRYINHLLTYLQCGQRRGLPPCQVTSWSMHTALWPQQTWAESWGGCCGPLWGGKRAGSPYVTQCCLGASRSIKHVHTTSFPIPFPRFRDTAIFLVESRKCFLLHFYLAFQLRGTPVDFHQDVWR